MPTAPPTSLTIGRSSSCNLVLDYRTVSTLHAVLSFEGGKYYIRDHQSSNGTMLYVKSPVHLKYSTAVRFRMGRTTLELLVSSFFNVVKYNY